LLDRNSQGLQEQVDLTDRKQVERILEIGGHKPSQEQVNRFLTSIKENEKKKKATRSKRGTNKEE